MPAYIVRLSKVRYYYFVPIEVIVVCKKDFAEGPLSKVTYMENRNIKEKDTQRTKPEYRWAGRHYCVVAHQITPKQLGIFAAAKTLWYFRLLALRTTGSYCHYNSPVAAAWHGLGQERTL